MKIIKTTFIFPIELLALFIEQDQLKQHYKNRLVGHVLNGYLSLRKLVVQRTKLIDDTQEKLLNMLEELTTGKHDFFLILSKFMRSKFPACTVVQHIFYIYQNESYIVRLII